MSRLFALLLIAVGAAALLFLWRQGETGRRAESWPQAQGEVLQSGVDTRARRGGGDGGDLHEYRALVVYRYSVGGVEHRADNIAFPTPGWGRERGAAERTVARYPQGARVTVYYDPQQPGSACLEAGRHWTVWAGMALALAVAAAGVRLLLRG